MAWEEAFTTRNITSGWRQTGLQPFKPEVVLSVVKHHKKAPESTSRPSTSGSSSSALSNPGARELRKLFARVVGKERSSRDTRARQLYATIEHIST